LRAKRRGSVEIEDGTHQMRPITRQRRGRRRAREQEGGERAVSGLRARSDERAANGRERTEEQARREGEDRGARVREGAAATADLYMASPVALNPTAVLAPPSSNG